MSNRRRAGPTRIALVGATGLIGRSVMEAVIGRQDVRLTGVARREGVLPQGVRMEMFVAEPDKWGDVFEAVRPDVLVCALGTTWNKVGKNEAAFRAIDHDLVLRTAEAAKQHGVERMICVSSVGAKLGSKSFYLQVKAEMERDLSRLRFSRLDVIRPSLLRGQREHDPRIAERAAMIASPLLNLFLYGDAKRYRAIDAGVVAKAILALAKKETHGRLSHEHDALIKLSRGLTEPLHIDDRAH